MDSANNKTSNLVATQLPEFIRRDHPLFIEFLEQYYKSLEQDGGTLYTCKRFGDFYDIDVINADVNAVMLGADTLNVTTDNISLSADNYASEGVDENDAYHILLQKFYDNFIRYIPSSILADRTIILKHSKDFYRATGTEYSVRFLTRILFNKEASVYLPQTNILKASDGKWFIEKSLNVKDITLGGIANTDASRLFVNQTIRGATSNSTAAVEGINPYYQAGVLINELKVSGVTKDFINGEKLSTTVEIEGNYYELAANLYSGIIVNAYVTNPGSGYTEGASVPIIAANGAGGQIIINKVAKSRLEGQIKAVTVDFPGAGYQAPTNLLFTGGGGGAGAAANINVVDLSETYHPTNYSIVGSTIDLVANTVIQNAVGDTWETQAYSNLATLYSNTSNLNISTIAGGTINNVTLNKFLANSNVYFETGDVLYVISTNTYQTVTSSSVSTWYITIQPGLPGGLANVSFRVFKKPNVNSIIANAMQYWTYANCGPIISTAMINPGSGYITLPDVSPLSNTLIRSMGILGRMDIISAGSGYANGDIIQFINPPGTYGIGANAQVSVVDNLGRIQQINWFAIPGHLPGGSGYRQDLLPTVNIISAHGVGANIQVTACLADGAQLSSKSNVIGSISQLKVISGGFGYDVPPTLDLSTQGDGTATAFCNTVTGVYSYPGRYVNQDGQLSSYNFLEDRDYYQPYSYVVKIDESLDAYRKPIKDLIHPAGLKLFGEYLFIDNNETSMNTINVINTHITVS